MLARAALRAQLPRRGLLPAQSVRHAGGGPTGYGSGPYRGIKIPKVAQWHKNLSVFFGTTMWLWLMFRAKQDGPVLLGLKHPWDH